MGSASGDRAEAPLRLWISRNGNPLSLSGLSTHIGRHTQKRFGWAMDPQSFRHCLATTLGKDGPEAALMGMDLLDHANFATTERYYIAAQAEAAHQHYEKLLEARRKASAGHLRNDSLGGAPANETLQNRLGGMGRRNSPGSSK